MPDGPKQVPPAVEQDERVRRIARLAERLLTDVARCGYGDVVHFDYLTPSCQANVDKALGTMERGDSYLEADFGETVFGAAYLPDAEGMVRVEMLVADCTTSRALDGRRTAIPTARWLLELEMDSRCTRISSLSVAAA